MKHIASRSLQIPANIDVLLCEQEVRADDTKAIDAVVASDVKRANLIKEKDMMEKFLEESTEQASDQFMDRLKQVVRVLSVCTAGLTYLLMYALCRSTKN